MAKILIIEDEKGYLDNICFILKKDGFETIKAENGEVGIKKAKEGLPDLILCDIVMPKKSGFDVLKEIKQEPETKEIPFIFLTVYDNEENIIQGFELGAKDYVSKTSDHKVLLARIRTHLELKEKRDILKELVNTLERKLKEIERDKKHLQEKLKDLEPNKEKDLLIADLKGQNKVKDQIIEFLTTLKQHV